ncbi:hypothetical protein BJ741DRAFT_599174 [Chytriomyces cf. hyalinus JEL632]|nr:hypothetical protein BJ741DRAFT_599174 [Chytriomyces cf. hyalinus JEL632]
MNSFDSTLIQTATSCLAPVAIQVATACGVTLTPTGSIAFATDLKTTMLCVCTVNQLATITSAVDTCLLGTTEGALINAEVTSICGKVNDPKSKCGATINPFGDVVIAATTAAGPAFQKVGPATEAACSRKKDIQAFVTECTDLAPFVDLNSVCSAGSTTTTTAAASASASATAAPSQVAKAAQAGKLLDSSSTSPASMGMLAIFSVAALF